MYAVRELQNNSDKNLEYNNDYLNETLHNSEFKILNDE